MFRVNIHSLREHLAFEMIEEERLRKGLIFEETIMRSPRKRLDKNAVLSQHRPDIRDLVYLFNRFFLLSEKKYENFSGRTSRKKLQIFAKCIEIRFKKDFSSSKGISLLLFNKLCSLFP